VNSQPLEEPLVELTGIGGHLKSEVDFAGRRGRLTRELKDEAVRQVVERG
jgi:hypothetical protein